MLDEMLATLNSVCLSIMDPLVGWMLRLDRNLVLLMVAVFTALILTVVRKFTTDQGLLARCKRDKARLKALLREAKKNRDKEAVARYRKTMGEIGMVAMKAELKPLLASLVPIALLATWCFSRIAYLPPKGDDVIVLEAYFPDPANREYVHVVPQEGLRAETGWIQRIREDRLEDVQAHIVARQVGEGARATNALSAAQADGFAEWTLRCQKRSQPYLLQVHYRGRTFEKELPADGPGFADRVLVKAYLQGCAAGELAGISPQDGLEAETGWVQEVRALADAEAGKSNQAGKADVAAPENSIAQWTLRCEKRDEPYVLQIRYRGKIFEKELIVDGVRYASPLQNYDDDSVAAVYLVMPEYKLLGVVPGLPWIALQPWIVGYLVIVLPFSFLLKPVLRIY